MAIISSVGFNKMADDAPIWDLEILPHKKARPLPKRGFVCDWEGDILVDNDGASLDQLDGVDDEGEDEEE